MTKGFADPVAEKAAAFLGPAWRGAEAAAVLGSGLGGAAEGLDEVVASVSYGELPGFGGCGCPGHGARLILGKVGGAKVLVFSGRRHVYEGISPFEAAYCVRLAARLGARLLVSFSAVGGISEALEVGGWMFVDDHLNLMGGNPLEGMATAEGPAFVDLSRAYRADLYEGVATDLGFAVGRGVYCAFAGPSYETPAEVRMARALGGDVVGMSLVPEAVWARFLELEVVAFARVANRTAGLAEGTINHKEVLEVSGTGGAEAAELLKRALKAWTNK